MIIAIGTPVRISHTGDHGIVKAFLDNDMVEVYLPMDDMSIPVSVDDLEKPGVRKPEKKEAEKQEEHRIPLPEPQFLSLRPEGLLMAFEEVEDGMSYKAYFLNDTRLDVLYSFTRKQKGSTVKSSHGKLTPGEVREIDRLLKTQLSDHINYEVDCWPVNKAGSGKKRSQSVRLRPKSFFKNRRTAPIINRIMHCFPVVESFREPDPGAKKEDLKSYTKKNVVPKAKRKETNYYSSYDIHDVEEFAHFVPEIDLHIEALHPSPKSLDARDILRYQLSSFDTFLAKAIRLGVDRVFVIHGIGTGKLRNAIVTRLMNNPDVETFKNEYHHKYGWGATEVVF
ncbi:MAG: Smr/MutS family protein [Bacteroidetes bacterium]|nr:Smr/MutS family protein [Bacteroidota bacterium]